MRPAGGAQRAAAPPRPAPHRAGPAAGARSGAGARRRVTGALAPGSSSSSSGKPDGGEEVRRGGGAARGRRMDRGHAARALGPRAAHGPALRPPLPPSSRTLTACCRRRTRRCAAGPGGRAGHASPERGRARPRRCSPPTPSPHAHAPSSPPQVPGNYFDALNRNTKLGKAVAAAVEELDHLNDMVCDPWGGGCFWGWFWGGRRAGPCGGHAALATPTSLARRRPLRRPPAAPSAAGRSPRSRPRPWHPPPPRPTRRRWSRCLLRRTSSKSWA
jgi:hypothetical protein